MKGLYFIIAFLFLAVASSQGQTLKSLMYNTTNGQVVAATNVTFTNSVRASSTILVGSSLDIEINGVGISGYNSFISLEEGFFYINNGEDNWDLNGSGLENVGQISFNSTNTSAATRTNLGATTIGNAVFTAANAVAARQALGLQTYTLTLTNSVNDVEIGSTISNVTVGWTIAPTNATYAVRTLIGAGQTNSITNNASTLALTGLALTSNTTWTLTVGDGLGITNTATTAVNFLNYMIWGRSTNTTLDNTAIQNLHTNDGGSSRAFATSRSRSFTMDGGGQYIFIAYPAGFGAASFTVGGLPNTAFTLTTNNYTNASGYATNYLIYRTDTIQNGTGINFVVQ